MTLEHMTDDDLIFIDDILEKYDNNESVSGASELDGFLTAIASSPETITAEEWSAAIWGGKEKFPKWESIEEENRFQSLSIKLLNYSAVTLTENPEDFEALFIYDDEGNEDSKIVIYWCAGYMRAVEMREQLWANLPDRESQYLAHIAMFSSDEHITHLAKLNKRRIAEFEDQIEPAAAALYLYWKAINKPIPANVVPFERTPNKQ